VTGPWREPPWWPTDELDAGTLLRTLVTHEVDFIVIGGLAVMFHGYVRATKDLDIVPNPDPANTTRLFDALQELGAEPREIGDFRPDEMPVQFGPTAFDHGGNWALLTKAGRIDVLQRLSGDVQGWEDLHDHAVEADIRGVGRVRFASYEDLVAMKRVADRPEDREDLDRLERIREDSGA
jgi:hypothetical protein